MRQSRIWTQLLLCRGTARPMCSAASPSPVNPNTSSSVATSPAALPQTPGLPPTPPITSAEPLNANSSHPLSAPVDGMPRYANLSAPGLLRLADWTGSGLFAFTGAITAASSGTEGKEWRLKLY